MVTKKKETVKAEDVVVDKSENQVIDEEVNESDDTDGVKQIDVLRGICSKFTKFIDDKGDVYIVVPVRNHKEILNCRSESFKNWLICEYMTSCSEIPSSENIKKIVSWIVAHASRDGNEIKLEIRGTFSNGKIYYDLADSEWRVIEISKGGWKSIETASPMFRRSPMQGSQIFPEKGTKDDVLKLLDFVNITNEGQRVLFLVSVIASFVPNIVHPIQIYYGAQGSAKSTVSKLLKILIDPSKVDLLTLSDDVRELTQHLDQHYFLAFDNLSGLKDSISDLLCKAVTGGGFSKRRLYSDSDNIIFTFKRSITLNGIGLVANKPDLLDRSLIFQLERILAENRKSESEFWSDFEQLKPFMLGGIFTVLSDASRIVDGLNLTPLSRMVDFERWGYAIAESLGIGGQLFLDAYAENKEFQNQCAIEENPLALVLTLFAQKQKGVWVGTASTLFHQLNSIADKEGIDRRFLPRSASLLSRKIQEVMVNLDVAGIVMEKTKQREWTISVKTENAVNAVHSENIPKSRYISSSGTV